MKLSLGRELADVKTRFALALACGVIGSLAFAPLSAEIFLFAGLIGFFWLAAHSVGTKQALLIGLFWGAGYYGPGLSWTFQSMHVYGGIPSFHCVIFIIGLALFLSIFNAIFAIFVSKINLRKAWLYFLVMPALWAILEWLRGEVITSFGWLSTGYAFADNLLGAYAPIGSVYLVGFVVALISASLLVLVDHNSFQKEKITAAFALGFCVLGAYGLNDLSWAASGSRLEVRLVQPALPVVTRPSYAIQEKALTRVEQMSLNAPLGRSLDLILWPESVYVTSMQRLPAVMRELPKMISERTGATVLFNAFDEQKRGDFRNSFWLADGAVKSIYAKRHLVPFGEYVPFGFRWFVDMMGIPMADQGRGLLPQSCLQVLGHVFAPGICYENLFTSELRDWFQLKDIPEFIVYNANLGWFGLAATEQFTQMSQMRARESARPVLQVINGGGSAYILPNGQIERKAGYGAQNLDVTLRTVKGEATPVMKWGLMPTLLLYVALIFIGLLFSRRRCSLAVGVCRK